MGRSPLTWQELESFQRQQGIELTPFELDVIRMASSAYVHQAHLATKPDCPPPIRSEVYSENVDKKVTRIFKSLIKSAA